MSAPLSTPSLANSLSLRIGAPNGRAGLAALEGLGAQPDSFSRTLDERMRTPEPAPREREPVREPERPDAAPTPPVREPERNANASEAATPPAQPPAGGANEAADMARTKTETPKDSANTSASQQAATSEDVAQASAAENASAAAGRGPGGRANATELPDGDAAIPAETLPEAAEDDAAAPPPTDPAALAGLPAAIAALLTGRAKAPASEGEPGTLQPAAEGGRKSAQHPGLLSRTELAVELNANGSDGTLQPAAEGGRKSAQHPGLLSRTELAVELNANGSDAGGGTSTPAFLLQGREFAAAAAATRAAAGTSGVQALAGDAAADTGAQSTGATPSHAPLHLLRQAPASQPATPQLPVATSAGEAGWAEDVGDQVRWMLGRAESKAELVLTPPNMGKLEVSISLNGDQTTAQFIASSQAARDALERAMPQLREALQQAGIMLGDANVSTSGQGRDGEGQERRGGRGGHGEGAGAEGSVGGSGGVWLKQQQGMVDTFA